MSSILASKILVPVDGSSNADRSLEFAAKLAKICSAKITALYVLQEPIVAADTAVLEMTNLMTSLESYGKEVLADAKEKAEKLGVEIQTDLATAHTVANKITEFAKVGGYDLIVMGTRGRSGVKRVLLGSVAFGVVTYAHCAVVIVR
ncbi:MAG: universal stress protein [Thaumarchaeota archaeon]|nr:universal stress protein [Nitrososphaerota archaeon]